MKRLMPSSLITFLDNNPNCVRADLFQIDLPTGTTTYVTSGQFDITVPSGTNGWSGSTTTFKATEYGAWKRGAITSEAGFSLAANSMTLTCIADQGTSYPGLSVGILNAAANGLFDTAKVTVWTVYMPTGSWGDVSNGIETKWFGYIEKPSDLDRVHVEFECQDVLFLMNESIPKRIIQAGCPWSFCDANCTLTASDFTVTFTAGATSTQSTLVPATAFSQAAGYFTLGVVTCTSGENAGTSQTVKIHDSSGNLELVGKFLLSVSAGDGFSVIKGCDKTYATCASQKKASGTVVNNSVHFGGAPAVPPPTDAAL